MAQHAVIANFPFSDSLISKIITHQLKHHVESNIDIDSIKVKTDRLSGVLRDYSCLTDLSKIVTQQTNTLFSETIKTNENYGDLTKNLKNQLVGDSGDKIFRFGYDLVLLQDSNSDEHFCVSKRLMKTDVSYNVGKINCPYVIEHRILFPIELQTQETWEELLNFKKDKKIRDRLISDVIKSFENDNFWFKSVCSPTFWDFIKFNVVDQDIVEDSSEEPINNYCTETINNEHKRLMDQFRCDYGIEDGLITTVVRSDMCDDFIAELGSLHNTHYSVSTTQGNDPKNRIWVKLADYPFDLNTYVAKAGQIDYKKVLTCRHGFESSSNRKHRRKTRGIYKKKLNSVKCGCDYKLQIFTDQRTPQDYKIVQFKQFHSQELHPRIGRMPLVRQVREYMEDLIFSQPTAPAEYIRSNVINNYKQYLPNDDLRHLTSYADECNKWVPSLKQCKRILRDTKKKIISPDIPDEILNLRKQHPDDFQPKLFEQLFKQGYNDTQGGMCNGLHGKFRVRVQTAKANGQQAFYTMLIPESEELVRKVFLPHSKCILIDATKSL